MANQIRNAAVTIMLSTQKQMPITASGLNLFLRSNRGTIPTIRPIGARKAPPKQMPSNENKPQHRAMMERTIPKADGLSVCNGTLFCVVTGLPETCGDGTCEENDMEGVACGN